MEQLANIFLRTLFITLTLLLIGGLCSNDVLAQSKQIQLKVLSYNIHVANPPSRPGVKDIEGIAKVINDSDADLVALQEVDVFTNRSGKGIDQAYELAKLTNRHYFFVKSIDHDGGDYGIAVLSRFPIVKSEKYPLPMAEGVNGEQRAIAIITVELKNGTLLDFASTHLDLTPQARQLQADFIVNLFRGKKNPVILGGDFNAVPESQEIRILDHFFKRSIIKDGFTIPVVHPNKEIDYIMYAPKKAFKINNHVVLPAYYASDHLPVLVEVSISTSK